MKARNGTRTEAVTERQTFRGDGAYEFFAQLLPGVDWASAFPALGLLASKIAKGADSTEPAGAFADLVLRRGG